MVRDERMLLMNLTPYDFEALLIGTVLRYGNEAANLVLPALTPDRFIYGTDGKFGSYQHRDIWRAVETTYLVDRSTVNIPNVLSHIQDKSDDIRLYLQALAGQVTDRYHVYDADQATIKHWAEVVDKVGSAYALKAKAFTIADGLNDQDRFEKEVLRISDIDDWTNNNLSAFRNVVKISTGGLQHISVAATNVEARWDMLRRGDLLTFLPCGMPTLVDAGFFAEGMLSVFHGISGGGKSAFVHQANLGVAIGLKKNNIQGSVAIFSLEMSQERLTARLAALLAGFNLRNLDRHPEKVSEEDYVRLKEWLHFVGTLPIYIDQTNMITTSAETYATEGLHASAYGPVRMCSADYMELFGDDVGENKEQKLDHVVHQNLAIARRTGAHFSIISQTVYPSGAVIYPAGPGGPRGSRAIQHAADDIYELWNPVYMRSAGIKYAEIDGVSDNHVTLFRQKGRDDSLGAYRLNWNPECTQYTDPLIRPDLVFDHLKEVTESINGTSAQVATIEDTSFGDF